MSLNSNKQRQISLKEMGGTKTIRTLPRETRALVLASLMQEAPAKPKSEKTAAFSTFSQAVQKADPLRAKKIAEKHSLDKEECRKMVSAKVEELRGAEGNSQSKTASNFEILFGLDEGAKKRFIDAMGKSLGHAYSKMKSDYAFAHVLFKNIIESESALGVIVHTKDAAAGMAVSFMQRRRFEDAFGTMQEYLLENGKIEGKNERALMDALKEGLLRCSGSYVREIRELSMKHGMSGFVQEAVLEMALAGNLDRGEGEKEFELLLAFGMKKQAEALGKALVARLIRKADASPEKSHEDYLSAARIALGANLMDEVDEAIDKYLSMCEYLGEQGRPKLLEEGMRTAQEFSRDEIARGLGKKAAMQHLSMERFEEAENIARESGNPELASNIVNMGARIPL